MNFRAMSLVYKYHAPIRWPKPTHATDGHIVLGFNAIEYARLVNLCIRSHQSKLGQ